LEEAYEQDGAFVHILGQDGVDRDDFPGVGHVDSVEGGYVGGFVVGWLLRQVVEVGDPYGRKLAVRSLRHCVGVT
jgi:hypothetical protein